ncbi:MAG: hypothetical protein GY852_04200 [bacterium]|nr:hypothetical protein [bacterium]
MTEATAAPIRRVKPRSPGRNAKPAPKRHALQIVGNDFSGVPVKEEPKMEASADKKFCPYGDTRKAWEVVLELEEKGIIKLGIIQWRLASIIPMEDALQFARLSAHKSVMCWDKNRAAALNGWVLLRMRDCWNEVYRHTELVHIPNDVRTFAIQYEKWLAINPGHSPAEYLEEKPPKGKYDLESLAKYMPAHSASFSPVVWTAPFDDSASGKGMHHKKVNILNDAKSISSELREKTDPSQANFSILSRVHEIVDAALKKLGPLQEEKVRWYFGIWSPNSFNRGVEMDCTQVGKEVGCTKQNAHVLLKKGIAQLATDPDIIDLTREFVEL